LKPAIPGSLVFPGKGILKNVILIEVV